VITTNRVGAAGCAHVAKVHPDGYTVLLKTVKELVALARKKPGDVTFSSPGLF